MSWYGVITILHVIGAAIGVGGATTADTIIDEIRTSFGAHGITFCRNAAGGWYGYFSNKFARVVGVVDAERQETVGYIPLPETAWGGNGIYCLPDNEYSQYLPGVR